MVDAVTARSIAFPTAAMRSMAGRTELAVAEAAARRGSRPERVTSILSAIYETISGQSATPEFVRSLPSGTREWLLQQAALHFRPDLTWFEAACEHCGQPYDISIDLAAAARQQPDNIQSDINVVTSLGPRTFNVPNGAHEEAFARLNSDEDPRRDLVALCGTVDQAAAEALQFNQHDLELIDEALEAASPDVADEARTLCPSCASETSARIDPLLFAFPQEATILRETHLIATAYGWPHDQILDLSVRHRTYFAGLISQDRGRRPGAEVGRPA